MKPATFAPVYAAMYPGLADIARRHGYALAVHGSMQRDFDLIAIPFTETAASQTDVIADIVLEYDAVYTGRPAEKPHGRVAHTLALQFGECFLDLSFMPRLSRGED